MWKCLTKYADQTATSLNWALFWNKELDEWAIKEHSVVAMFLFLTRKQKLTWGAVLSV